MATKQLLGLDISNYSAVPTPEQVQCWVDNRIEVVCIGLQNATKARAQQAALGDRFWKEYYVDLPGRDLTIPEPGAQVWIDVETGCFVRRLDVDNEVQRIRGAGLIPNIYGNEPSIIPVLGSSKVWAGMPLIYANYPADEQPPDFATFKPFNGWTRPRAWQYTGSRDLCGVNVDLDVFEVTVLEAVGFSQEEVERGLWDALDFVHARWNILPFTALGDHSKAVLRRIVEQL